jgi:hypothetical protein
MLWKNALKYPVLAIGILWMAIYLSDSKTVDFWNQLKYRFHPALYSCESTKQRIEDQVQRNWKLACPHSQFLLIRIEGNDEILASLEKRGVSDSHAAYKNLNQTDLRKLIYQRAFNNIVKFISVADQDTLESFKTVKFNYKTDRLGLLIASDGPALRKMRDQIYLIKKSRLFFRSITTIKSRGITPVWEQESEKVSFFNKETNKKTIKLVTARERLMRPSNVSEELWNDTLKQERDKLVRINLKNLMEKLGDKSNLFNLFLKVKEYDPKKDKVL